MCVVATYMTTKQSYKEPSVKVLDVLIEGVVCDSDVVVTRPDYGDAVNGEW